MADDTPERPWHGAVNPLEGLYGWMLEHVNDLKDEIARLKGEKSADSALSMTPTEPASEPVPEPTPSPDPGNSV